MEKALTTIVFVFIMFFMVFWCFITLTLNVQLYTTLKTSEQAASNIEF